MSEKPEPSQFAEAAKLIDAFKTSLNGYEKFIGAFTKSVHDSVTKTPTPKSRFYIGQIVWHNDIKQYVSINELDFSPSVNSWRYRVVQASGESAFTNESSLSATEPCEIQVGDKVLMDTPKRGCWFKSEKAEVVRTHVTGLLGVKILRTNQTYWVRDYAVIAEFDVKPTTEAGVDWESKGGKFFSYTLPPGSPFFWPKESGSKRQTTTAAQASKDFEQGQTYYFTGDNSPFWKKGEPCTFIGRLSESQIEVAKDGAIFRLIPSRVSATNPNATKPEVFKIGDIVYIKEDCPGFKSGDKVTVVDHYDERGNCRVSNGSFSSPVSVDRLTKTPPTSEEFELGSVVYLCQACRGLKQGTAVKILYKTKIGTYGCWDGGNFKEVELPSNVLSKTIPRDSTYDNQWIPPDDFTPDPQDSKGACYGYSSASMTNDFFSAEMTKKAFEAINNATGLPAKKIKVKPFPFFNQTEPKLPTESTWPSVPNEASQFKIHDLVNLINATGFPCSTDTVLQIKSIDRDNRKVTLTYKGSTNFNTTIANIRRIR